MNLHDAIIQVLNKVNTPLSCQDIADIINKNQLYKKKDLSPIKGGQISVRINKYPCLFKVDRTNKPMLVSLP
ncbi:HTH domain-containing protein [Phocaeicola sartorii]|uniref:HTH domain-containing protein n=1 Tax=Phocaeicola sartorii TaxID=671267 RepID=UPI0035132498